MLLQRSRTWERRALPTGSNRPSKTFRGSPAHAASATAHIGPSPAAESGERWKRAEATPEPESAESELTVTALPWTLAPEAGAVTEPVLERAVGRLARGLKDRPVDIEEPAVIAAPYSLVADEAEFERGAAMRAMQFEEPDRS